MNAQQEIVTKYEPFVHAIARKVKKSLNSSIELDDLISYGMTGLLEAADRYDARHGTNFTTFSYYRVRGAIYDGLRKMGYVSRTEYQKIRFGEKATAYLENVANRQKNNAPSGSATEQIEELANQVGQLVTIYVTSLEAQGEQEFEDQRQVPQDKVLHDRQLRGLLQQAVKHLSKEDQELIALYYFQDMNLEQAGQQLGLSKSWMSRRHSQVIDKLGSILLELMDEKKPLKAGRR